MPRRWILVSVAAVSTGGIVVAWLIGSPSGWESAAPGPASALAAGPGETPPGPVRQALREPPRSLVPVREVPSWSTEPETGDPTTAVVVGVLAPESGELRIDEIAVNAVPTPSTRDRETESVVLEQDRSGPGNRFLLPLRWVPSTVVVRVSATQGGVELVGGARRGVSSTGEIRIPVELTRRFELPGRVVAAETGAGVPGATVRTAALPGSVRTDAQGYFSLPLEAERHSLPIAATAAGYGRGVVRVVTTPSPGWRLEPAPAALDAGIRERPVATARPDGSILVQGRGRHPEESEGAVDPEAPALLIIELPRPKTLRGRLGTGWGPARVVATGYFQSSPYTYTEDGREARARGGAAFEFADLNAGVAHAVFACSSEGVVIEVSPARGGAVDLGTIAPPSEGARVLRVVDSVGKPVAGACCLVQVTADPAPGGRTVAGPDPIVSLRVMTDPEGRAWLPSVEGGTATVEVQLIGGGGRGPLPLHGEGSPGGEIRLEPPPGAFELEGRVLVDGDLPLAVELLDSRSGRVVQLPVSSDGAFRFSALDPSGAYLARAVSPTSVGAWIEVAASGPLVLRSAHAGSR